ncbi:hypothetical protein A3SI_13939 [Nitritalea halalkaliphila LW7]|uniref:Phytase-like domain-containing protein n=1 Tax=Nitritalea halalkaliphila LW7 TaxID=1189621 RepID=I5C084_9BACT|nr:DUF4221 family protein [Nitritalea halalkaliphila]EIM75236.1 hypothetical protein A3SI_13939 [Nitritalea halalkaliphila LW7]
MKHAPVSFAFPPLLACLAGLLLAIACARPIEKKMSSPMPVPEVKVVWDTLTFPDMLEPINLTTGFSSAVASSDGLHLYRFDSRTTRVEAYDVENRRLSGVHPFQEEGPDGIGFGIKKISLAADGGLLISSATRQGHFHLDGRLKKEIKRPKFANDQDQPLTYTYLLFIENPKKTGEYLTLVQNLDKGNAPFLLISDANGKLLNRVEFPELNKMTEKLAVIRDGGQWMGSMGASPMVSYTDEQLLIQNSAFNEAYRYFFADGQLQFFRWHGPYVGAESAFIPPKKLKPDTPAVAETYKALDESIRYGRLNWDPQLQRYYRLSTRDKMSQDPDSGGFYRSLGTQTFVSVFDADLNLIAESRLDGLHVHPGHGFARQGQLLTFRDRDEDLIGLRFQFDLTEEE